MPSKITELLGMYMRRSPVSKILAAQKKCESRDIPVTIRDLEAYAARGHDPDELAEALLAAKRLDVDTSVKELSAISMTGRALNGIVEQAAQEHQIAFDVPAAKTKDGAEVEANCTLIYRLSPAGVAFHFDIETVRKPLAEKIRAYIEAAPSKDELQARRARHEEKLKWLAVSILTSSRAVTLNYR